MVIITEHIGDIFSVPEGSVLIHACNCQGAWGSGIAAAMKANFPAAYEVYRDYCLIPDTVHHKKWLLGTTLLIPPQEEDAERYGSYWIACPFTSLSYGRYADKPDKILENTRKAIQDLRQKLQVKETVAGLDFEGKVYGVRINGKAFKTPWLLTRRVLEQCGLSIKIMNNLDVMDENERQLVLGQMEEWGHDAENVQKYKAAFLPKDPDAANDSIGGRDRGEDVRGKLSSSEAKWRKHLKGDNEAQVEKRDRKKRKKKNDHASDGDNRKKSKKHLKQAVKTA